MSRGNKAGYTLIEAMVSVALVAIGVVSVLGGYASLMNGQRRVRDTEQMQRLALDKFNELLSTDSLQAASLSGDFADRGYDRYTWSADVEPTGVENLSAVTVRVESRDHPDTDPRQSIVGTVFVRPETAGTTGAQP